MPTNGLIARGQREGGHESELRRVWKSEQQTAVPRKDIVPSRTSIVSPGSHVTRHLPGCQTYRGSRTRVAWGRLTFGVVCAATPCVMRPVSFWSMGSSTCSVRMGTWPCGNSYLASLACWQLGSRLSTPAPCPSPWSTLISAHLHVETCVDSLLLRRLTGMQATTTSWDIPRCWRWPTSRLSAFRVWAGPGRGSSPFAGTALRACMAVRTGRVDFAAFHCLTPGKDGQGWDHPPKASL